MNSGFVVLLLLRNNPPKKTCFCFLIPNQMSTYQKLPGWEVWASSSLTSSALFTLLPGSLLRLPLVVQCCTSRGSGASKPSEENKQEESSFPVHPEVFVPGDSTGFTPLVALPSDAVLRSTSPPFSGRVSSVFGIIIHPPIPLLSTFVQKFVSSA